MNMDYYYRQFENCLQEEKPFCSNDCPFSMDVLSFMDKMSNKRYNAAYKIYRNAVAFPHIVASLCPEYCTGSCPRKDFGGSIMVNTLEKTCISLAKNKKPNEYNLPMKNNRIAVIGGGLSGLACALRLASKKYQVHVYEKSDAIGGSVLNVLPPAVVQSDIQEQFQFEDYTLHLCCNVTDLSTLTDKDGNSFDAVYIATGRDGDFFHKELKDDSHCCMYNNSALFAGGQLVGSDLISSIADGLNVAQAIENYIKTSVLTAPSARSTTDVQVELSNKTPEHPPAATNSDSKLLDAAGIYTEKPIFTEEEMSQEVARCFRCQCNSCRSYCDIADYFKKWPLQMRDEIMTTTMPAGSLAHKTPAIKLINTCTQCSLCDTGCPGGIQLGQMIRDARRILHKINRMPGAYHQFWVNDMEFANGIHAAMCKTPPGKTSCRFAYFPGCHLGAADPLYVDKTYRSLLASNSDVGILLQCCSLPSDWAGNEELHTASLNKLKSNWQHLGSPTLIVSCLSCMKHLKEYLPEIPLVSVYEIMNEWDIAFDVAPDAVNSDVYSVFDPCSSGDYTHIQEAVRSILKDSNISFEEFPMGRQNGCCGFGGNVEIASPKFAETVADKRSSLSSLPYITYCINCRDVFKDNDKPVRHLFDILYNIDASDKKSPTVTQRRKNRIELKDNLLREIWNEAPECEVKPMEYKLVIASEIAEKMDKLKLLEDDISQVLEIGEKYGRKTYSPDSDTYKCYNRLGHITCWVEYRVNFDEYHIINVYIHRMKIELEEVWNGKKVNNDLP